jgi:hypothetical protein
LLGRIPIFKPRLQPPFTSFNLTHSQRLPSQPTSTLPFIRPLQYRYTLTQVFLHLFALLSTALQSPSSKATHHLHPNLKASCLRVSFALKMHHSPGTTLFAFLVVLVLALISPSVASPITDLVAASQSISIPPVHNGTLVPPSGAVTSLTSRQQKDWTLNLYWQSQEDGSYVPMSVCDTNYEDGNMCSVGYFTSKYLSSVGFSFLILPSPKCPPSSPRPETDLPQGDHLDLG